MELSDPHGREVIDALIARARDLERAHRVPPLPGGSPSSGDLAPELDPAIWSEVTLDDLSNRIETLTLRLPPAIFQLADPLELPRRVLRLEEGIGAEIHRRSDSGTLEIRLDRQGDRRLDDLVPPFIYSVLQLAQE